MTKIKKIFLYLKYYFEPNDKYVRDLAYNAAKGYFNVPLRNASNPYPRISEYNYRREAFLRYQRAFNDRYRHEYAKNKVNGLYTAEI